MNSVYIHIPFCKNICSYCDFCKMLYNSKWAEDYLKSLREEIVSDYDGDEINTLYIGGGTPSCLSIDEIKELLDITLLFKKNANCEFTFECNINDITDELLELLKKYDVNRLSVGIESFDKSNLELMKRPSKSYKEVVNIINEIKTFGFNNLNLDLIYALPNESFITVKKDLERIISLKPTHISTYSLIINENTELCVSGVKNISEDVDAKMYEYIVRKLKKKGYIHYEISNFALPSYESRHNLNYWNNNEYYGFGLGAGGNVLGLRYSNTKNLQKYLDGDIKAEKNILSKQERMDTEIMLGLRKTKGINLNDFYNKYQINMQDIYPIKKLIKEKLLIYKDGYVYIPKNKLYIMDEIILKLL